MIAKRYNAKLRIKRELVFSEVDEGLCNDQKIFRFFRICLFFTVILMGLVGCNTVTSNTSAATTMSPSITITGISTIASTMASTTTSITNFPTPATTTTITALSTSSQTTTAPSILDSPQGEYLFGIIKSSDGNQWFAESIGNKISKISPQTGQITKYNIPTANAWPTGITADSAGNLWFMENLGNKIGKICSSTGVITEYNIPNTYGSTITFGPDGNLWFPTVYNISEFSPKSDAITTYSLPNSSANTSDGLVDITPGSDGNLWFTEQNKIGKISPLTGQITEYNIPIANAGPKGITNGPDGNLWFTEANANQIGKISPLTGQITEYNIPTTILILLELLPVLMATFGSLSKMGIKLVKYLPRPVRLQNTVYPLQRWSF